MHTRPSPFQSVATTGTHFVFTPLSRSKMHVHCYRIFSLTWIFDRGCPDRKELLRWLSTTPFYCRRTIYAERSQNRGVLLREQNNISFPLLFWGFSVYVTSAPCAVAWRRLTTCSTRALPRARTVAAELSAFWRCICKHKLGLQGWGDSKRARKVPSIGGYIRW